MTVTKGTANPWTYFKGTYDEVTIALGAANTNPTRVVGCFLDGAGTVIALVKQA